MISSCHGPPGSLKNSIARSAFSATLPPARIWSTGNAHLVKSEMKSCFKEMRAIGLVAIALINGAPLESSSLHSSPL